MRLGVTIIWNATEWSRWSTLTRSTAVRRNAIWCWAYRKGQGTLSAEVEFLCTISKFNMTKGTFIWIGIASVRRHLSPHTAVPSASPHTLQPLLHLRRAPQSLSQSELRVSARSPGHLRVLICIWELEWVALTVFYSLWSRCKSWQDRTLEERPGLRRAVRQLVVVHRGPAALPAGLQALRR